jgi:hypothetical protein
MMKCICQGVSGFCLAQFYNKFYSFMFRLHMAGKAQGINITESNRGFE